MKLIFDNTIKNKSIKVNQEKLAIIINKDFEKNIRTNWFKGSRDRGIN
tara:strand:- start:459 stop:602 length:144 start_codon:yes stop_codon:yes gene_type:complete